MFITKTMNESADMNFEQFDLIDSICESYEDLLNFNEALAHFDIKEQELIHTESADLEAFREEAMDKAKTFLKDLVAKIKVKWNQFINFMLKKMVVFNSKLAYKVDDALESGSKYLMEKAIDRKELKVKFFSKISKLSDCVDKIIDFTNQAFDTIDSEKDLTNFKPAELFKELVGEVKDARIVSGEEIIKATEELITTDNVFIKSVETRFDRTIKIAATKAYNTTKEKEAAHHLTLINLKGQQIVKVALSALVSLSNTCAGILIKSTIAYRNEINRYKKENNIDKI